MTRNLGFTNDDPLWPYVPLGPARPAATGVGVSTLNWLDPRRYYDAMPHGISPLIPSVVPDVTVPFGAFHGVDGGGTMQPDDPTWRTLNQIFAAHREENQGADNTWRMAEGVPVRTLLTGQNSAFVGTHPTAHQSAPEGSITYAQLRRPDQRTPASRGRAPHARPQQPPQRQAAPLLQAPADEYPAPGISIPPPPTSPPEQPGWGQLPQSGQRPIGNGPADPQLRRSFADRIAWAEGNSGYRTVGRPTPTGSQALGRYQLLPDALVEAGVLGRNGRTWTGPIAQRFGVHSRRDFLNNPTAQEAALRHLMLYNQGQIRALRLDRYIGRVVDGVLGHFVITYPGLMAATHRVGQGDLAAYLRRLEERGWRSRGHTLSDRDGWAETRLRVFADAPYSTD